MSWAVAWLHFGNQLQVTRLAQLLPHEVQASWAGDTLPWGHRSFRCRGTDSSIWAQAVHGLHPKPVHTEQVVKTTGWVWMDLQHTCRVTLDGHLPTMSRAGVMPPTTEGTTRHSVRRCRACRASSNRPKGRWPLHVSLSRPLWRPLPP